jgi:hypothetical protein
VNALISSPSVLLHHDGELSDIARLLEELGTHTCERLGPVVEEPGQDVFDVVIATPRRILQMAASSSSYKATRIAVLNGDSKTLRSHLRRISVDLMIRRPVHPAALRLFLLHILYRGPERRNRQRVSIGARIRFRTGLIPHSAILADFSTRGCRLISRTPVSRDTRIKLKLSSAITHERTIRLTGMVLRSAPAIDHAGGFHVMAVRFQDLSAALLGRLQAVLDVHAAGPARLSSDEALAPNAACASASEAPSRDIDPATRPESPPAALLPIENESDVAAGDDLASGERRTGHRHSYDKRIVALGDQATRVLLGRDISTGGMRVDSTSALSVDESLQIALHSSGRNEPVIVQARVLRDDGDSGIVLQFENVDDGCIEALQELIADLPVEDPQSEEAHSGIVVSEIIDRESALHA